jgi:protein-disulfide isomerase
VWKHLPLEIHKDAPGAHLAAMAANKQGKFWEFHDKLFENQRELNAASYQKHAQAIGLDTAQFEKDLLDLTIMKPIEEDKAEAKELGVTGTPGFFVNGRYLSGAKPFEDFAKVIDAELTRLSVPLPPRPASN